MTDWTYRDALNARLARLSAVDVPDGVDRRFEEGKSERLESWQPEYPETVDEVIVRMRDTVEAAAIAMATTFDAVVDAIRGVCDGFQAALDDVNAVLDPDWQAPEISFGAVNFSPRRHPASRLRVIPGRQYRQPVVDQRPAIQAYYARRHR